MKIYKILGAGTAALALLAASYSAQAADIPRPVYKGVRSVVAYYNWTGFYVGINGGYSGARPNSLGSAVVRSAPARMVGWWAARSGSITRSAPGFSASRATTTGSTWTARMRQSFAAHPARSRTLGSSTARGRVGYAFDRWLPYLTGGGAFGRVNIGNASGTVACDTRPAGPPASASNTHSSATGRARSNICYVDLGSATCGVSICTTGITADLHRRHHPRRPELQVLRTDLQPLLI